MIHLAATLFVVIVCGILILIAGVWILLGALAIGEWCEKKWAAWVMAPCSRVLDWMVGEDHR